MGEGGVFYKKEIDAVNQKTKKKNGKGLARRPCRAKVKKR